MLFEPRQPPPFSQRSSIMLITTGCKWAVPRSLKLCTAD